jgi:dUTP pyrophosphatase
MDEKKTMPLTLKVQCLGEDSRLPTYGHPGDAGLDLFSAVDHELEKGQAFAVPTGIKIAVPEGFVGLVWDKSGISLKGVHRLAGVIDSGYRGEVKVVLINLGPEPFSISVGMKVAQLLIQPVVSVQVVKTDDLENTSRGEKGFGSTGLY